MNKLFLSKIKAPRYYVFIFIIFGLSNFACSSEIDKDQHQDGVIPLSVNQVLDVFELKYGDTYEGNYLGQTFKFSITDIEDNIQGCESMDVGDDLLNNKRVYAFLHVDNNNIGKYYLQKVSSKVCGLYDSYHNDGTDVQQIVDALNGWRSDSFSSMFNWAFGEGTLLTNTSFSIYMAKAYPNGYPVNDPPSKSMYKFIFIVTKK